MALLAKSLPAPVHLQPDQQTALPLESVRNRGVHYPPYGQRHSYKPRSEEDFGDGGAFPECHMSQFPLGMGRKEKSSTAIVPVTLDSDGKIKHESILGHRSTQKVYANPTDLVPVDSSEAKPHPDEEEVARVTQETRAALEKRISTKIAASRPSRPAVQDQQPEFIRYTPANQQSQYNSGASNRLIRLVEAPVDPLDPPKFKHKKVPRGPPSPPPPVMHSPPRKLSQKDVADWKIPPCISNWKNPKGYTIPLDKRLAADGRGLQQIQINDGFAKLTESLVTVERNAREAVAHRNRIRQASARNKIQQKEDMLRKIAEQSRDERSSALSEQSRPKPSRRSPSVSDDEESDEDRDSEADSPVRRRSRTPPPRRRARDESDDEDADFAAKEKRDMIRKERERERERDRRMEAMGRKTKAMRDADRDISEKVALGQKAPATKKDTQYDARLFSGGGGMDSGFGADDDYRLYDKPLLRGSNANTLYRPKAGDSDVYGDQGEMDKLLDTKKFKPNRDFDGVDRSKDAHARSGPVQFESTSARQASPGKDTDEDDPFGLDAFLRDAKTTKPLDKIGTRGQLHAGSSGAGGEPSAGTKRSRVEFEAESKEYKGKEGERERGRDRDDRDGRRDRDDRDRRRDRDDRDQRRDRDDRDGRRDRDDRDRRRDRDDRDRRRDREGDRDRESRYEREEKRRRYS